MSDFKLLFVCLGNICRSPAAEGVMSHRVKEAGLQDRIHIDSAGTAGWHTGKRADERMRKAAAARGVELSSLARQVMPQDLEAFDLVLVMDEQNFRDVRAIDPKGEHQPKVRLFCEFCTEHDEKEVPDPYYGGEQGFQQVLDIIEDGCDGVLRFIQARLA